MADNTDEEHLENPINIQSENPPDEIISAIHTESISQNQETENMEVHHHSHSHGKKNWKSYLWEFLMLFLAVFCGFLAEYQLEHKIERERAKEYIHSFYEDLKNDTAKFSLTITNYQIKNRALSKMYDCYDSVTNGMKSQDCFEDLYNNSKGFYDLAYTDRTIQQLKNAGGLRLLKTRDADSILQYDNLLREYAKVESTSLQEIQSTIRNTLYTIVDFGKVVDTVKNNILLKSDNTENINKYFNELLLYYQQTQNRQYALKVIKGKAISLLIYFKEKYDFD